jgi:hypothetical protein
VDVTTAPTGDPAPLFACSTTTINSAHAYARVLCNYKRISWAPCNALVLVVNSGRTSAACVDLTRQHRPSTHPLVSPNNIRRRSFKGTRHHDSDPWLLTAREPVSHYFAVPVLLSFACLLLLHSYSLRSYIGEGYISNTEYYTFGNTNVYVKILLYVF